MPGPIKVHADYEIKRYKLVVRTINTGWVTHKPGARAHLKGQYVTFKDYARIVNALVKDKSALSVASHDAVAIINGLRAECNRLIKQRDLCQKQAADSVATAIELDALVQKLTEEIKQLKGEA